MSSPPSCGWRLLLSHSQKPTIGTGPKKMNDMYQCLRQAITSMSRGNSTPSPAEKALRQPPPSEVVSRVGRALEADIGGSGFRPCRKTDFPRQARSDRLDAVLAGLHPAAIALVEWREFSTLAEERLIELPRGRGNRREDPQCKAGESDHDDQHPVLGANRVLRGAKRD